jgi:hypothetical protein
MLDPNARYLYLEALRPPEGYHLDRAVATTFSLDLLALLMVPLSFAMFECEGADQALKDPLGLVEALRRTTDKLAVFCQRGQIAIPPADQLLYSYLEPMVVEVMLPNHSGVFHPKVWLMRFMAEGEPTIHRFLCLSRNLTFDKSWDTVLVLEGTVQQRKVGYSRNRPLSDFIAHLPNLARGNGRIVQISDRIVRDIELLSEEVRRVDFKPPSGFKNEIAFRPVGIPGYRRFSIKGRVDRLLIVSPFLSGSLLTRLTENPAKHILVSRVESLDELREDERARFSEILVMDEAAARLGEVDEQNIEEAEVSEAEDVESGNGFGLFGLHAKLFVSKAGWDARLWTGSANATNAAFDGRNVEFMVELYGKHGKIGIDKILGHDDRRTTFRDLLKSYVPPKESPPSDPELHQLEEQVKSIRRELLTLDLRLSVRQVAGKSTHDLVLSVDPQKPCPLLEEIEGRCWPITLQRGYARDLSVLFTAREIVFTGISTVSVTSFLAFELTAKSGEKKHSAHFVLNLPIEGIPEDRNDYILRSILSERDRFLRYLMFLLSEEGTEPTWLMDPRGHTGSGGGSRSGLRLGESVLMEKLVRAYSRAPEKLDRIAALVDDLCKTPEGRQLLPEGFEELWRVIWEAKLETRL